MRYPSALLCRRLRHPGAFVPLRHPGAFLPSAPSRRLCVFCHSALSQRSNPEPEKHNPSAHTQPLRQDDEAELACKALPGCLGEGGSMCMYACTYVCTYVCMYVCILNVCSAMLCYVMLCYVMYVDMQVGRYVCYFYT